MARELSYRITGDARDFQRTLRSVDNRLASSERRAHRFGNVIRAAVGVGAVSTMGLFAKKTINAASDVNEALTKNQQIFGRHAGAIDKWSRTTADGLGVSRREALSATGTFGNLFAALQIGERPSATMSRRLVRLAADLASFNNADPKDVLESLRSGLAGESEPMRRFGAFLSEGRVQAEAYATGIARTGTKLTEQQKIQARYNLILKDTAKAHGDFGRTSSGVANQQRILRARFEDLKATLGDKLLPIVNRAIGSLNRFIGEMKSGKGAGGEFARTLKDVAQAGEAVAKFLRDHPGLIKIAVGAWAAYKVASLAALATIKVGTFRRAFMKSVPAAGAAGAAAGTAYSTSFAATSSASIAGLGKGGRLLNTFKSLGKTLGIAAAATASFWIAKNLKDKAPEGGKSVGRGIAGVPNVVGDSGGSLNDRVKRERERRLGPVGRGGAGLTRPGSGLGGVRAKVPSITAPNRGIPREPAFAADSPSRRRRKSGGQSRQRGKLNDWIRGQQDTVMFNLEMGRITAGVAADQLDSLAAQVKKGKALRRELLVGAKNLRDQARADAQQAEDDAEQARRDAAEARKAAAQKQRDAAKSARQYMRDQRRSHREELRRVRKRKRGDGGGGSGDFQLNVGDVRVPTVYEVRRHGAMRAAAEAPKVTGSKAQPTTTVNGGVHIVIDGAKNPKQIAAEVAAVFDHTRKTHGRAVKRAQARARAKR